MLRIGLLLFIGTLAIGENASAERLSRRGGSARAARRCNRPLPQHVPAKGDDPAREANNEPQRKVEHNESQRTAEHHKPQGKVEHHEPALPSKAEQAAAARLTELGATVVRDAQGHVKRVALVSPDVTDDDLAVLGDLPHLAGLKLGGPRITDAAIAHVGRAGGLQVLELNGIPCTDAGLEHLAGLESLELLTIQDTRVRAAGFNHLHALKNLKYLLCKSDFIVIKSDEVGKLQQALPELKLDLFVPDREPLLARLRKEAEVTLAEDQSVSAVRFKLDGQAVNWSLLERLPEVQELDLSRHGVTDDDLKRLAAFEMLEVLDLGATLVSDAGLAHLKPLKKLRFINIEQTAITADGIKALREVRPEIKPVASTYDLLRKLGIVAIFDRGPQVLGVIYNEGEADDGDFAVLAKHPELNSIRAPYGKVTDAAMKALADGKIDLVWLDLRGTQITDAGLAEIGRLGERLRDVNLGGTKVTSEAVQKFVKVRSKVRISMRTPDDLNAIKALRAAGCDLRYGNDEWISFVRLPRDADDKLVEWIAGLKRVEEVWDRDDTIITDAGLKRLGTISSLKSVVFVTPHATEAGIKALRAALPGAEVHILSPKDPNAARVKP